MKRPRILVCNDDGIHGLGLPALVAAMKRLGHVTVSVPEHERSADSHSLTLHKPLRVRRVEKDVYTLNGSPADCTRFAVLELLKEKVDLVVSGINHGFNLGEDVIYSGTVAAAMEGVILSIPAIAFSQDVRCEEYKPAAAVALRVARQVLRHGLPPGLCLNVNFPPPPKGGHKTPAITKLGRRIYGTDITRRADPRGRDYFWLAGSQVQSVDAPGTDVRTISRGQVSVTPLHLDITDHAFMRTLGAWKF